MYSANLIGKQMDTEFGLYLPEYSIPAPEVQTNYKEIPFRDGAIDKTSPDGVVHYKDREWDLTFKKTGATVSASDLAVLAMSVMNAIHGKAGEIIFDDDPNYKWVGRVFVTSVNCENNGLLIVNIHMITHPYKYSLADIVVVDEIQTTSNEYEGSIVSLIGGIGKSITELLVSFSPIQDLHGYSSPWPAGGGANQWDEEWERGTIGLTTGAKVDDNTKIRSKNYVPISPNTAYYYKFPGNWRMVYFDSDKNVVEQGNTYSPNIILTSPATAHYLLFALDATTEYDNNIAINYPSTVTTYSPYSNICPITGRTGLSVYNDPKYGGTIEWNQKYPKHTGYNYMSGYATTGLTVNVDSNGFLNISGSPESEARIYPANVTGVSVPANHVCLILCDGFDDFYWSRSGFSTPSVPKSYFMNKHTVDFSAYAFIRLFSGTAYNIHARFSTYDLTQMFGPTIADYIYGLEQANAGAGVAWFRNLFPKGYYDYNAGEETCVSAVNGDPYWKKDIDWTTPAGTVYGGTLDVVTGVLTVDRASRVLDGTESGWQMNVNANHPGRTYAYNRNASLGDILTSNSIISSYVKSAIFAGTDENSGIYVDSGYLWVRIPAMREMTAVADWTTYLSNNPLQVCYELATPLTYQLTPQEVVLLAGTNNIWSTGDSVSVTLSTMDKVTLVNHGNPMNPKIKVVSEGSISLLFEIDGVRYTAALSAGEYTLPDLVLFDGSTDVYEAGEGTITYTYPEVSL